MTKMVHVNVKMPPELAAALNHLVEAGWFLSRSEVVRAAAREFLKLWNNGELPLHPQWAKHIQADLRAGRFNSLPQAINRMVAYYYRKGRDLRD